MGRQFYMLGASIRSTTGSYDGQEYYNMDALLGLHLMFNPHERVSGTVPFVVNSSVLGLNRVTDGYEYLFSMNDCFREGGGLPLP